MAVIYTYLVGDIIRVESSTGTDAAQTMNDFWTWERTQTQVLLAATDITAGGFGLTTQVRPAERLALGGAAFGNVEGLDIVVGNPAIGVFVAGTLTVTGTDAWGNVINENIVIAAIGNFTTVNRYQTVTNLKDTTGGNYSVSVQQNKLGRIWKLSQQNAGMGSYWFVECLMQIGRNKLFDKNMDFSSTEEVIEFDTNRYIYTHNLGLLQFGTEIASVSNMGRKGSIVILNTNTNTEIDWLGFLAYGSTFICKSSADSAATAFRLKFKSGAAGRGTEIRCCLFSGFGRLAGWGRTATYYEAENVFIDSRGISGASVGVHIGDVTGVDTFLFFINGFDTGFDGNFAALIKADLDGFEVYNSATYDVDVDTGRIGATVNSAWDRTKFRVTNTNNFFEDITVNIRVIDEDGNGINNATVVLDRSTGTQEFSVTTDANGDIAEQEVRIRKYTAGDPAVGTDWFPQLLKISKAGYLTYETEINLTHYTSIRGGAGAGLVITLKRQKILNLAEEIVRIEED